MIPEQRQSYVLLSCVVDIYIPVILKVWPVRTGYYATPVEVVQVYLFRQCYAPYWAIKLILFPSYCSVTLGQRFALVEWRI